MMRGGFPNIQWTLEETIAEGDKAVAYLLYTRALSVAQQIRIPENDGNVLVARIRTDQQAAFDLLRMREWSRDILLCRWPDLSPHSRERSLLPP
jgi:hypothetical protein